jgi:hypothetical protein
MLFKENSVEGLVKNFIGKKETQKCKNPISIAGRSGKGSLVRLI